QRRARVSRRLRSGGVGHGALRRELQLARADLVPRGLPPDRGARALPPLLRGLVHHRGPDGRGPDDEPAGGRARADGAQAAAGASGWERSAALSRNRLALCRRSALQGPGALPRVLPRRHRPRRRREPPDGVDGSGGRVHREDGTQPAKRAVIATATALRSGFWAHATLAAMSSPEERKAAVPADPEEAALL